MENKISFKSQKPRVQTSKKISIDLTVGGEVDEVPKHTDGDDAGNTETATSSS